MQLLGLLREARRGRPRPVESIPVLGINDQQGHLEYFAAVLSDPQVIELLPFERRLQDGIQITRQRVRYEGVNLDLSVTLQEAFLAELRKGSSPPGFIIDRRYILCIYLT